MDGAFSNPIQEGDYIIVQRHNFIKLHQVSNKGFLALGKDKVDVSNVIGKSPWSLFKMVPKESSKREFNLIVSDKVECLSTAVMKDISSGHDNRNILNDNKSQLLTTDDITGLREKGLSSSGIVSALIENSTTFKKKTEFSQAKYLNKKEKKYHEYIMVRKPSLRLLSEVLFNRDQFKLLGLRYDTLSQILTAANIQPAGVYLLYENGTQGLVGAAILNYLSETGILINLSLGNHPPKQAILAMNFRGKKIDCMLNVKIRSILQTIKNDGVAPLPEIVTKNKLSDVENDDELVVVPEKKRKLEVTDVSSKRPKWVDNLERTAEILMNKKVDGFIIASKEYPLELLDHFLKYIKLSRPLVIYSVFREVLVQLYCDLKKRTNVIGLHLTENWLREYQVLPERTHPNVNMSPSGGFLLTAIIIDPS